MPASMTGAPLRPKPLDISRLMEAGIDWIYHAPMAPRTGQGTRFRKFDAHPFSPANRVQRSGGERRKSMRSPLDLLRRATPTRRRRNKRKTSEGAAEDPGAGAVPPGLLNASDSFNAASFRAALDAAAAPSQDSGRSATSQNSGRRVSLLAPKTPAPMSERAAGPPSERLPANPSSAKTPAAAPRKTRRRRLSDVRDAAVIAAAGGGVKPPPACFPTTPAPPKPPGEAGLSSWLMEAGLDRVYGLLDCLLFWKNGELGSLALVREAANEEILEAIAPIKLKGCVVTCHARAITRHTPRWHTQPPPRDSHPKPPPI